ncbi:hypothetical protein MRB53_030533 [Persea americana]|uniref:Uncharacterized protein n=1 Tax=Persea americana TaxID=3435 RepID=A0ACC2KM22_PERAE|nr:hypothetical protein MRB53_030533 [Persea americana]
MSYFPRPYSYSKIEEEDPDELKHRRAQWLIARALEQADSQRRRRFRVYKLKIKIGKRFMTLRRSMQCSVLTAKAGICRQFITQFKLWKRVLRYRDAAIDLPPLFG